MPQQPWSSKIPGDALLENQVLNQLPDRSGGVAIQVDTNTEDNFNQTLHLFIAEDGASITTRYLGPGRPGSVSIVLTQQQSGDWNFLQCQVTGSLYAVALAKWQVDATGKVNHSYVRRVPIAEWRILPSDQSEPYPLGSPRIQWRPWVDGVGVGDWRLQ